MAVIYLVRHAQAEGNLYRRFHGWCNGDITVYGKKQIAALSRRFQDIPLDAVYSSDLKRAMTTAHAAADPHGLEVIPEPGLREMNIGVYDDLSFGEMNYRFASEYALFKARSPLWDPPGGETFAQVGKRMADTIFRLAEQHPRDTIALFSHSIAIQSFHGFIRDRMEHLSELSYCPNTGVSCYEIKGGKLTTLFENDSSHIPPELSLQRHGVPEVRFRPLELYREAELYENARIDGWLTVFPDLLAFDGPGFLREAREQQLWDPRALQCALLDDEPVGILQLATLHGVGQGVGYIPYLWVRREMRRKGIGAQLVGQAMSTYRSMGRKRLQLQCSPANEAARSFYLEHGFVRSGRAPGVGGTLDLLEKEL